MELTKEESLEFQWGKAGLRGKKNPSVQFYRSFRFDGTDYALYDCVYLWKDGVQQPFVGKLVKIWEQNEKVKRVKVHWFFHPHEISYYLKDKPVLENEVFLSTGKDVGVANVNSLEAIAGKCNVVCISKDCRNPQPSNEELSAADYVFYRTFDVDSFSISDKWGDRVGDLEVKFIFNRMNEISNNPGLSHGVIDDRNVVGVRVKRNRPTTGLSESVDMGSKVENHMQGSKDMDVRPAKKIKLELGDGESKVTNPISLQGKEKLGSLIDKSKKSIVTRRPNVEKNSWFRDPRWEENRILTSQEQGTLILLQNLDPEYTSGEVEDIIWHAFEQKCSAKMVQHTAISSPFYGQALVILKSKEAADRVLKRLSQGCLMLPNGRPLVGGPARLPTVSQNQSNFVGHLSIDKIKHKMQKDMKEAVSTSHYSQPNTIEFEMAMEWFLLQARSTMWWKKLHKKQTDEMEKIKAKFKG